MSKPSPMSPDDRRWLEQFLSGQVQREVQSRGWARRYRPNQTPPNCVVVPLAKKSNVILFRGQRGSDKS
jgi:hypothetical protein